MMALLLVFPTVMAFEWDNVKSYDDETRTATITNALGLGEKIAEIQLNSPLILLVPEGYGKVAEFTITSFSDYDDALKELELYDKKRDDTKFTRDYDYKYLTYNEVEVPNMERNCFIDYDGERNCEEIQKGTKLIMEEEWVELSLTNLKENDVLTIGIFTDVQKGDSVEWIPNMFGERIDEWAGWAESLNAGLTNYYRFDEAAGDLLDKVGNSDGTITDITTRQIANSGSPTDINTGYFFDGSNDVISCTNATGGFFGGEEGTLSFWFNSTYPAGDAAYFAPISSDTDNILVFHGGNLRAYIGGTKVMNVNPTGWFAAGDWVNMVFTWDDNPDNYTVWINGVVKATSSTPTSATWESDTQIGNQIGQSRFWNGVISEVGMWNREISQAEIDLLYSGGDGMSYLENNPPIVTLNNPTAAYSSTSSSVTFNWTAEDNNQVDNSTLYIDGIENQTFTHGTSNFSSVEIALDLAEGFHTWNVTVTDDVSVTTVSETRNISIDTIAPIVDINSLSPVNYHLTGNNLSFNWSITETNPGACKIEYPAGTNTTVTCGFNNISLIANNFSEKTLIFWMNDTSGQSVSNSTTWTYNVWSYGDTASANAYETAEETFSTNYTSDGTISSVNLHYNGTSYASSPYVFGSLPALATENAQENRSFFWEYVGVDVNSTASSQIVKPINLTACVSGTPYLNITFADEKTLAQINASMANTWNFYIGDGTAYRSNTYINTTYQFEYDFCFQPVDTNITLSGTSTHENPSYPQRLYNFGGSYSNTTTEITVYLLGTSDGIYTTFQVLSPSGNTISGVTATVTTIVGGSSLQTDAGTTGDDGGVTFWVNPDKIHTFLFSKAGYDDKSVSLTPTQSQYTVYMGGTNITTVPDYTRGIGYSITPAANELTNNTAYSFNLSLTSTYNNVDSFGYVLTNGTDTLGSANASTNGGNVTSSISTGNNEWVTMDFFWEIDGNYTNMSRTWTIQSESKGYGLVTFFDRLKTYTDDGIFGLNAWSRTILIFLLIFIIVGVTSYYTGAYSPAAVVIMLFGLVVFFDAVLGMIPAPPGAISNFATVITFFLMSIVLVWEAMK